MIKNIVLNGFPDLFHLHLISALMKAPDSYRFFFWGREDEKQVYFTLSHRNKEMRIYESLIYSIPWINTPLSVPFDIWQIDSAAKLFPCFSSKIIDENDKEIEQLSKLSCSVNANEIVYSSSIYRLAEENESGALFATQLCLVQNNEEIITKIGEMNKVAVRIISSPLLLRGTSENIINYLFDKVFAFVKWVDSRMPDYFLSHSLTLPASDTSFINTISMSQAISAWRETYENIDSKHPDWHECETSLYSHVSVALEKLGISTAFSDDPNKFTLVDSLLVDYLRYYFPKIEKINNHPAKNQISSVDCLSKAKANVMQLQLPTQQLHVNVQTIVHQNGDSQASNTKETAVLHKQYVHTISDNSDGEITYFSAGQGEAILLCSAYGIKTDVLEKVVSRLSENYRVISWSTRETVSSPSGTRCCGVADQAEDIALIADAEQLSEFSICSWCSSVKSAVIYQKMHPDRVKTQIFIAGEFAPYQNSQIVHSAYRNSLCRMAELVEKDSRMIDFFMRIIHSGVFVNPEKGNENRINKLFDIVPIVFRGFLLEPFRTPKTMMQYLAMCIENYSYDITDCLREMKVPTLLICADHDRISPSEQTKWAHHQIGNSHLACLPASSHLLILERSDEVCSLIDQHICLYTEGTGR